MSDAGTTSRSAVDLAALARVARWDLAASGSEAQMAARRDLRHRAHDERQRMFELRRKRRLKHEKYIRKMRRMALRPAAIGLVVGFPVTFFLATMLPSWGAMLASAPPPTLDDCIMWSAAIVCGVYTVLMATGGIAFLRGRNWGRRAAMAGLIVGLSACLACAATAAITTFLSRKSPNTDEFAGPLVSGVIFVAIAAWHGFEARRLGSIRCRAWCSLKIRRSESISKPAP